MEQYLREIRDKIIRDGYKNNNYPKTTAIRALQEKLTVPTLYRILDERIIKAQISQMKVIDKAIKKV